MSIVLSDIMDVFSRFIATSSCFLSLRVLFVYPLSGGGGAVALWEGSIGAITASLFSSNEAGGNGGHILAAGNGTYLSLDGPLVMSDGIAAQQGGALHVAGSAVVELSGVTMSGNRAEEGGGGALSAIGAEWVKLEECNVITNSCAGDGGGAKVVGTEFSAAKSIFEDNVADVDGGGLRGHVGAMLELEDCRMHGNEGRVRRRENFVVSPGHAFPSEISIAKATTTAREAKAWY